MIPNASEVVRRRWTVVAIVRLGCIPIGLTALIPLASWFAEGISDDDLLDFSYYADRIATTIVLLVTAFVGVALARPIAWLVVPARVGTGCPRCRYRLEGLVEPRCPECGLMLPPEFMGGQSPPDRPEPRAVHLVKLRDTLTPIVRLLGGLVAFFYFFAAIGTSVAVVTEFRNDEIIIAAVWLVHFWLGLVLGCWMLFRGERVAAMLVPKAPNDPAPPASPPSPGPPPESGPRTIPTTPEGAGVAPPTPPA